MRNDSESRCGGYTKPEITEKHLEKLLKSAEKQHAKNQIKSNTEI